MRARLETSGANVCVCVRHPRGNTQPPLEDIRLALWQKLELGTGIWKQATRM